MMKGYFDVYISYAEVAFYTDKRGTMILLACDEIFISTDI